MLLTHGSRGHGCSISPKPTFTVPSAGVTDLYAAGGNAKEQNSNTVLKEEAGHQSAEGLHLQETWNGKLILQTRPFYFKKVEKERDRAWRHFPGILNHCGFSDINPNPTPFQRMAPGSSPACLFCSVVSPCRTWPSQLEPQSRVVLASKRPLDSNCSAANCRTQLR